MAKGAEILAPVWAHISTLDHMFIEPGALPNTLACTVNRSALGHRSANEFHKNYH